MQYPNTGSEQTVIIGCWNNLRANITGSNKKEIKKALNIKDTGP